MRPGARWPEPVTGRGSGRSSTVSWPLSWACFLTGGVARYQEVATHPDARRQGLAATLLCHAARYATGHLAATTLVIVADPGEPAIGVYRGVGFADRETEVSVSRAPS
jgi:ribosomal protein S18 acetylase RimI-like enzyme